MISGPFMRMVLREGMADVVISAQEWGGKAAADGVQPPGGAGHRVLPGHSDRYHLHCHEPTP